VDSELQDDHPVDQHPHIQHVSAHLPEHFSPRYVCAVGSSGDPKALTDFFSTMPVDLGMSYLVVQDLTFTTDSQIEPLLSTHTKLNVVSVAEHGEGIDLIPDTIFVIPPKKRVAVRDCRLVFIDPAIEGENSLPIDQVFSSLANDLGDRAIAIVLSGTGSDGVIGTRDIHRQGGLVMAQDPATAQSPSMPERAIETGLCVVVDSPEGLSEVVSRYVDQSLTRDELRLGANDTATSDEIRQILSHLRDVAEIDFSIYRPSTIVRRVERRMSLSKRSTLADYADLVRSDSSEADRLLSDLLIGVTWFYRDVQAFELLQRDVLPKIIRMKSSGDELRVWVAGCATGEEAYTVAILIDIAIQHAEIDLDVKIFASDVHRHAINQAGQGVYDRDAVRDMPAEMVSQYFSVDGDHLRIDPRIRQQIVFVQHNLLRDAPFMRMDLVTCRNMLIYLQQHAQRKCLSQFHFALNVGSHLFLGSTETVGLLDGEFETVSKKWRLYRKRRDVSLSATALTRNQTPGRSPKQSVINQAHVLPSPVDGEAKGGLRHGGAIDRSIQEAYDYLLSRFLPAGFLIDSEGQLLHTFGNASELLVLHSGRHSTQLHDLILPEFQSSIATGLQHALRDRKAVRYGLIETTSSSELLGESASVIIQPLGEPNSPIESLLVCIESVSDKALKALSGAEVERSSASQGDISSGDMSYGDMQSELRFTRENLQAKIASLQSRNQEQQSLLQDTLASNSDLQASNQELQSVNEELSSLNTEVERKLDRLQDKITDLDHWNRCNDVAVMFLDEDLQIWRFTPKLAALFNLRSSDIGRSISTFQTPYLPDQLVSTFDVVQAVGEDQSVQIEISKDKSFLVSVTAMDRHESKQGLVIHYADISALKEKAKEAKKWAKVVESTGDCVIALDMEGNVAQWNQAASLRYGWSAREAVGRDFSELVVPRKYQADFASAIQLVRSEGRATGMDSCRVSKTSARIDVRIQLSPIRDDGKVVGVSSIEHDIGHERNDSWRQEFLHAIDAIQPDRLDDLAMWQSLVDTGWQGIGLQSVMLWRRDKLTGQLRPCVSTFSAKETLSLEQNEVDLNAIAQSALQNNGLASLQITAHATSETQLVAPSGVQGGVNGDTAAASDRLVIGPLIFDQQTVGVFAAFLSAKPYAEHRGIDDVIDKVRLSLGKTIDARNHADELLRVSNIVENASDFVATWDAAGRVVSINRAGRLLTGISLNDSLTDTELCDIYPDDAVRTIIQQGIPAASRMGTWTGETAIRDRNGNQIPVSQLITAHRDDRGTLLYMSTICRVIDEQKNVQRRLEELIDKTHKSDRAATAFLANVSHDLRNPMTSVIGMSDLLLEQKLEPSQHKMVKAILAGGRQVTQILEDLLDFSRVENGTLTVTPRSASIKQIFKEAEIAFQPAASERGLQLVADVSGLPDFDVQIDPIRVRQIIDNLVANAIRFTRTGEVRVVGATGDFSIEISVIDTGCGINASLMPTIFDPHQVVDPKSAQSSRGAGVGLAISRELARLMEGELKAESDGDSGSRFTLTIPLYRGKLQQGETAQGKTAQGNPLETVEPRLGYPKSKQPLSGHQILVVEDVSAIQFLVEQLLVKEGAAVRAFSDGKALLDELLQDESGGAKAAIAQQYSAMLLDMQMPVTDGYTVASRIREAGITIPIIAMTACVLPSERNRSLASGCDAFVSKPIERDVLLETVWCAISGDANS
jgi:two-component system CheB/CheR fusion protein